MGRRGRAVLLGGLVAGTLDGAAACLDVWLRTGRGPDRVFRYIASGVFGREAFTRDDAWLWGVVFHFVIATGWALALALAYPGLRRLGAGPVGLGLAYGVVVWLGMNLVVVPLSRVPAAPLAPWPAAKGMAILMVCVGLPLALLVARAHAGQR